MSHLDQATTVESAVYQAIGAGSTCWENLEGTGVFNDTKAREVAEELLEFMERLGISRATALPGTSLPPTQRVEKPAHEHEWDAQFVCIHPNCDVTLAEVTGG
jgi:ABC-type thiamine transport system substrate-binding protein